MMCDTTSSVLNQRSLVISDHDTELEAEELASIDAALPPHGMSYNYTPTTVPAEYLGSNFTTMYLWGTFLLDLQKPCANPF
jgi:hypothetical protein